MSHFDCPGGGQVWVEGTTLYIGHMRWPNGTTIVDVADPRHPRQLATIDLPQGWHSHKVRVANGIMIVNHEQLGDKGSADFESGHDAYVSADSAPAQGPPHHGGRGRGRRQAAAVGTFLLLDLRHHARAIAGADRNIPGARARR